MPHISESAPLQISRFYTGWYSYRNPLIVPVHIVGRRIIELYDSISDGLNMEPSNRLTLRRRPGYIALPRFVNGKALYFTSFKPSSFPNQIYPVVDTTIDVEYYPLDPARVNQVLFAKETTSLSTFANIGAYLYIAHEQEVHRKWDAPGGIQGVTNWGIDIQSAGFGGGPHLPTVGANLASTQPVDFPWTNPGNITAIDGALATTTISAVPEDTDTKTSGWLAATGFGFTADTTPHAEIIRGFQVQLFGLAVSGQDRDVGIQVRMLKNGQLYGTFRNVTLPLEQTLTPTFVNLGRPDDAWDGSWTPTDVNNPNFGVAIQAVSSSGTPVTFSIDAIEIQVTVVGRPKVVAASPGPGETGITTEIGFQYQYCYGNSHSGHISSPTIPSFFDISGDSAPIPLANQVAVITLQISPDPQVNEIHVFRTTDGGGWPFLELPNSPVPNVGDPLNPMGPNFVDIHDSSPDDALVIGNVCPDPFQNDPPPGGAVDPVWFGGRLWLHRGNQLFYATGPDVSMGNGQEAWFPVYVFAIPSGQIVRKFPIPNGMLVFTHDEILIVRGFSTPTYTVNDFVKDIGMRTWTAAESDGSNIYVYTTDKQLLLVNPNGFSSVSANIADQIAAVNPRLAYVSLFRFQANFNYLFVGDGSTFLYPYNQELPAWAVREQPVGGAQAIGQVEVSPGIFQFWRSRPRTDGNSMLSHRDTTGIIFADEGIPYPCHVIFGAIPLADLLTLAQIRDIALNIAPTNTQVLVSAIANEVFPIANKQFELLDISSPEPPELSATPSLSYIANRYTWKATKLPELVNHIFFRIDFSAAPNPDELFVWTIGGSQTTGGSALGPPGQLPQIQGR